MLYYLFNVLCHLPLLKSVCMYVFIHVWIHVLWKPENNLGVANTCHHCQLLKVGSVDRTQVLTLASQLLYTLIHHPKPFCFICLFFVQTHVGFELATLLS